MKLKLRSKSKCRIRKYFLTQFLCRLFFTLGLTVWMIACIAVLFIVVTNCMGPQRAEATAAAAIAFTTVSYVAEPVIIYIDFMTYKLSQSPRDTSMEFYGKMLVTWGMHVRTTKYINILLPEK